ncbi:hypothetical protein [Blastochloris tepida]|uniref:Uncharacterized protein n=1 Tax=Blastochloris tepida TaxID=2233851 RepID=A0A348G2A5_9HYPH|nr:hypothetical protein [Blastochloris tepida]BBF93688.1 hypothetical protein BLTE_23730 [Blastochloris tepida]
MTAGIMTVGVAITGIAAIGIATTGITATGITAIGRFRHTAGEDAFVLTHTSPALYLKQKNAFL